MAENLTSTFGLFLKQRRTKLKFKIHLNHAYFPHDINLTFSW